ncbi:glutathione S-transferase [Alkalimarinus coralli]|uniref:glutathione S-transferase n=1 Tax=Alkalimarinus coralli TaxID=2935863 RepID=UPI00202B764B|nr:glutathione S-transferase [Alkalimarinus coralli]
MSSQPVLYSFRRCPYAMRARMALSYSAIPVELRETELKNKPAEMLDASAKGTVPVLVMPDSQVIDESWDIITWALEKSDPQKWMPASGTSQFHELNDLIHTNDYEFKGYLDRYKYADRYPEYSAEHYRAQGEAFLGSLERRLNASRYILGHDISVADIAIMPFIRQFAHVDINWFEHAPYPKLRTWLKAFLQSSLFNGVMKKYKPWQAGDTPTALPTYVDQ